MWTAVHEQLAADEMPPADRPQPTADERRRLRAWIVAWQRESADGVTRRLNRRELSAALQDVTGLPIDFAAGLPGDGKVDGFDTGADGLQDSADSVTQEMQVARRAVDALRFLDADNGSHFVANLRTAKDGRQAFDPWKSGGLSASTNDTFGRPGIGLHIRPKWLGDRGGLSIRIPPPTDGQLGVLRLSLVVSRTKNAAAIPDPRLWIEIGGKEFDFVEVTNDADRPKRLEYFVHWGDVAVDAKGLSVTLCNRVEMPYSVPGFENEDRSKPDEPIPGGTGLFRPLYDQKSQPPESHPVPFVVLHDIEIVPDYRAAWPPAAWREPVVPLRDDTATARQLLGLWMERAWRRPTTAAEEARFFALYENLRKQGESFDAALRAAFQSVLLSGSFRYLAPANVAGKEYDSYQLASRLGFMLWGAPPDAELRQLAAAGKLRDPQVLDAQVDRLLNDPRSDGFFRSFVTQWLELGQPITVAMDHIQKQDFRFGRYLKASMQEETIAFVATLIAENFPVRELIDADWTMMNDILARHYGYDGVVGGALQKVTLRNNDPRGGGILGHAGIQSMLCWMGDNWVIYRGAWALRHLLDAPPPPPPLEVPELIPSDSANHGKTFKELLRQHQADDRCSVCHKAIDPLGFAFQNFDLSGRWRDVEYDRYVKTDFDGKIEWRGVGKTRPVDSVGSLPRGETFQSFAECKDLIARHYTQDIVRGLWKNLILYGTGRRADVEDLAELRLVFAKLESRNYPLRELLHAFVRSRSFLEK